jgi:hypothetical protein
MAKAAKPTEISVITAYSKLGTKSHNHKAHKLSAFYRHPSGTKVARSESIEMVGEHIYVINWTG